MGITRRVADDRASNEILLQSASGRSSPGDLIAAMQQVMVDNLVQSVNEVVPGAWAPPILGAWPPERTP